ncbi:MAG: hypothetical protein HKN47_09735 [Pirellulaceae bacterium]|nr:hypothetical protein [Pirellulaceae bacterium]
MTKRGTTQHHLIPRGCHHNKWFKKQFTRAEMQQTIPVCRDCHNAIHRLVPKEKTLGRLYNTVDALLAHEQIAAFIQWARKQR